MSARGTRAEISIPRGVPLEVSTLLRQINAAASGPILTLEIDEVTNSIVVFAPEKLGQEVAQFVRQLDDNAAENASQTVDIISLERMNTKSLQQALQILSRDRSRRRSR